MDAIQEHWEEQLAHNEPILQVGDLGTFSMKEIYDALINNTRSSGLNTPQCEISNVDNKGDDSDCSWTHTEENGDFYFSIRRQLDDFILAADQSTMMTSILSRRQRRFVHATAQVMRLGHASLGAHGRSRRMIIFKDESASVQNANKILLEQDSSAASLQSNDLETHPCLLQPGAKRRKRVQKMDSGFPCRYEPCRKVFNRASERTKHEQTHNPALTSRFPCTRCNKGFRYPKDLRRHQKVHDNPEDRWSTEILSSSFGSAPMTSALTSDSRVHSGESLNFSSNPVSKDNSPRLVPWSGICGPPIDLEPFVLDETAWLQPASYTDDSMYGPFDKLAGFGFDEIDEGDEDFLEMASLRK